MRLSDTRPWVQRHPQLARVYMALMLPLYPIFITYRLWADEWDRIVASWKDGCSVVFRGFEDEGL